MPIRPIDATPRSIHLATEPMLTALRAALVERRHLTENQARELWERSELLSERFDRLLVAENAVPEEILLHTLADVTSIPLVSLSDYTIDPETVRRLPARLALRYHIIPVMAREEYLMIAADRLPDLADEDNLRLLLGMAIRWVLCRSQDVTESIKYFYGLGADILETELPGSSEQGAAGIDVGDALADSRLPSLTKFVMQIIHDAIQMNATDVHFDPTERSEHLRYRVDGVLYTIPLPEGVARYRKAISTCVKVMAQLDISDRRLPQDGRIKVAFGKDTFDVRVSVLPSQFGESMNLRILNRRSAFLPLQDIGFRLPQLPMIESLIRRDHGIVLITGPTGSGKTTTLYATLDKIRSDNLNIITIEDPVEYQMGGIAQIQVHPQIGLTFAAGLRSILRHDPDVILVGEIRDTETADIAIRCSLTGHLVFSTLHTNNSAGAVTRLLDMGIEPYLISSTVNGVIAQRLVRCICSSCSEEAEIPDALRAEMEAWFPERKNAVQAFHGRGCPQCRFTGYKGRRAICEILAMNDDLRDLVVRKAHTREIMNVALNNGMSSLRYNGWASVLDGITTIEDVLRVAGN
jgi:type II secretory ATPase GspE/PulE/Tfp pilus assembly ATPase PilB-like protein